MEKTNANLRTCMIGRVNNGWILTNLPVQLRDDTEKQQWVFTDPESLAKFISDNFRFPEQESGVPLNR